MAWTDWKTASTIEYWTDGGVEFTDGDSVLNTVRNLTTVAPIVGVTVDSKVNSYGSRGLVFADFGFDTVSPLSVSVEITAQRLGRIVDTQVQLINNGVLIGRNVADLSTENFKVYTGTVAQFWNLKPVPVTGSSFGVLLDFGARPDMPSRNPLVLRTVRMRLEY